MERAACRLLSNAFSSGKGERKKMKFLDILKRKTTPAPLALAIVSTEPSKPRDEAESLQDEITTDQVAITSLEAEIAGTTNELAETAGLAVRLKISISEGSSTAATELDELELKQRATERRHEGLRLRIATLQTGITPKIRRAGELAQLRDAMRQDQTVSDLTASAEAMTEELLGSWRNACSIGFDLMTMLDGAIGGRVNLDAEHVRQLRSLNTAIGKRLLAASVEQANARWMFARCDIFHALRVVPGKPVAGMQQAPPEEAAAPVEPRKVAGLVVGHL
jgi:chromosome segregation ATPase